MCPHDHTCWKSVSITKMMATEHCTKSRCECVVYVACCCCLRRRCCVTGTGPVVTGMQPHCTLPLRTLECLRTLSPQQQRQHHAMRRSPCCAAAPVKGYSATAAYCSHCMGSRPSPLLHAAAGAAAVATPPPLLPPPPPLRPVPLLPPPPPPPSPPLSGGRSSGSMSSVMASGLRVRVFNVESCLMVRTSVGASVLGERGRGSMCGTHVCCRRGLAAQLTLQCTAVERWVTNDGKTGFAVQQALGQQLLQCV
jgi:hypothetical protein